MAGLTSEGLVIKTLPEIKTSLENKLKARYGSTFNVGTNTPEGVMIGIFSDELSDAWEGFQGAYDASYPKSATSLNLDNVSDRVNIRRIAASKSYTTLEFTGTVGSVIPQDSVVTVETTNERFAVVESLTLSSTQFSEVILNVTAVADSTNYSVTIDGELVTINSGIGATATTILTALQEEINTSVSGVDSTLPTTTTLLVNVVQNNSVLPLTVGAGLGVVSVSDIVTAEAVSDGVVLAPTGSLNTLLVPIGGVVSVINKESTVEGRLQETDEELRVRRYESVGATSTSTYSAVLSKVANIEGVEFAFVIANSSASVDSEGVPSKAFEVVVLGGNEDVIAQTIFDNAPIAIESFGAITKVVADTEGNPQTIKFSRPTNVYIHVNCTYKDYTEEFVSPTNTTSIRNAIVEYGNSLPTGKDVIPARFFGSIYAASTGVGEVNITVAKSYDGITPITPYSSDVLVVNKRELPIFRTNQTTVTKI